MIEMEFAAVPGVMPELMRRVDATEKTLAKYRARSFDWNGSTCLHLARAQLVNMGHTPPPLPMFRTALGAKRALKVKGYSRVGEIMDALGLTPIAAAEMWVGDIGVVPGQDGWDSVVINAGGALLGWHEEHAGIVNVVGGLAMVERAWRL